MGANKETKKYYHAILRILGGHQCWCNYERQKLIQEIVVPFINKQIISVNYDNGKAVMNLGTVTYLRILKTDSPIKGGTDEALKLSIEPSNICTDEVVADARLTRAPEWVRSILQLAFVPPSHQIFVVMRIDKSELDSVYRDVIQPSIEKYGYKSIRADSIPDSGPISEQILEEIARSEIVLCELSGNRPNCYYEIGFAHALGKETILSIREDENIHFDLAGLRFIKWRTPDDLRVALIKRLEAFQSKQNNLYING